ncbi:antA/AntB antirepressor family protein [Sedimenticola hydrogenitrophicus]|uniref:antA/AntB antirepressor family protein n=1 Tax=Sedimenticola hydrogenitrophicus TaxID=2967975 RepID=UPI0023AF16CF|nr:antA/AntB antirepressor family protein [Sedimenticola hydrogenitrophicus]
MNELIKIEARELSGTSIQTCNARVLWEFVESKQQFADWIKDRIEEYGFVEGEDFYSILSKSTGGRPRTDYHLTLDMAKELAMIENNDIGRQVRRYFIRAEAELRARIEAEWHAREKELLEQASHMLPLPGVDKRARDGLRLRDTLTLRDQSRKTLAQLLEADHPAQRKNLWYLFKQVNDALGVPTPTLAEIEAVQNPGPDHGLR